MKIKVNVDSMAVDTQQASVIKENIQHEIYENKNGFKNIPSELTVHLFSADPLSASLIGSGCNEAGKEIIKITYSLIPPHTRNYFFLVATEIT